MIILKLTIVAFLCLGGMGLCGVAPPDAAFAFYAVGPGDWRRSPSLGRTFTPAPFGRRHVGAPSHLCVRPSDEAAAKAQRLDSDASLLTEPCFLGGGELWLGENEGEGEVIEVVAPEIETPAETLEQEVDLDDRKGEGKGLGELLGEVAGIRQKSLGGLGSFSAVSIRGATGQQTLLYIDNIPLPTLASGVNDLSLFDYRTFARVLIRKGLGGGGNTPGGTIRLETRVGRHSGQSLVEGYGGAGSWGTHMMGVTGGETFGPSDIGVGVAHREGAGHFKYLSNNGTPLNPDDDEFVRRANNQFQHTSGYIRGNQRWNDVMLLGGLRLFRKKTGVPPAGHVTDGDATLTSATQIFDVTARKSGVRNSSEVTLYGVRENEEFVDPLGTVGLATQDRAYKTRSVGGISRVALYPKQVAVFANVSGRMEWFRDQDKTAATLDISKGKRWVGGVESSAVFSVGSRWQLQPGASIQHVYTRPTLDRNDGAPRMQSARNEFPWSGYLVSSYRTPSGVQFTGGVGRYFRIPSLIELYGDRGPTVGNPGLRAEEGEMVEGGLRWKGSWGPVIVEQLAANVFARSVDNLIAFLPAANSSAVAQNIGKSKVWGAELAVRVGVGPALLTWAYTVLQTKREQPGTSFDGKELPQVPAHDLYARLSVELGHEIKVTPWAELSATSSTYLDGGNNHRSAGRTFLGAGVQFALLERFRLSGSVQNLLNKQTGLVNGTRLPLSDFFNFPLPGRSFYLIGELKI